MYICRICIIFVSPVQIVLISWNASKSYDFSSIDKICPPISYQKLGRDGTYIWLCVMLHAHVGNGAPDAMKGPHLQYCTTCSRMKPCYVAVSAHERRCCKLSEHVAMSLVFRLARTYQTRPCSNNVNSRKKETHQRTLIETTPSPQSQPFQWTSFRRSSPPYLVETRMLSVAEQSVACYRIDRIMLQFLVGFVSSIGRKLHFPTAQHRVLRCFEERK